MRKYLVVDWGWMWDLVGHLFFLVPTGLVLYVWTTSIQPAGGSLGSVIAYYVFLCLWIGLLALVYRSGITVRWSDVDREGLVVHEGLYGIVWRRQAVARSAIAAVERYDDSRKGRFGQVRVSGVRVRLCDGGMIVLTERNGSGKYGRTAAAVREALGMAEGDAGKR